MLGSTMPSDYIDYYHKVKEFGKKQKWDEKKINAMLGDRVAFEKEWKIVSISQVLFTEATQNSTIYLKN